MNSFSLMPEPFTIWVQQCHKRLSSLWSRFLFGELLWCDDRVERRISSRLLNPTKGVLSSKATFELVKQERAVKVSRKKTGITS
jgi:hypothetical protein